MLIYGPLIAAGRAAIGGAGAAAAGSTVGSAAGGAAAGSLLGKLAVPLAAGAIVHSLDSNDAIGSWVDGHIPGAAAVDDFAYRHSGGWVGRSAAPKASDLGGGAAGGTQDVRVVNPGDLARAGVSNLARQGNRPDVGASGFDNRGSVQPSVNTGLQ